jgi:hypothetical protein
MEAEIAGLLGTLVGACASIGTTFLSNRHAIHLQSSADANNRQEKARAFQRDNLLACQEMTQIIGRLTAEILHEETLALHKGTPWTKHIISEKLNHDMAANRRKFSTLIERVADDALRNELKSLSMLLTEVLRAGSFDEAETAMFTAFSANEKTMALLGNVLRKTY